MFKNPKTQYEIGYNAGFKAHQTHVAKGQIARMEADFQAKNDEIDHKQWELDCQIDNVEMYNAFVKLVNLIKSTE